MRGTGADQAVVAKKPGNAGGAKDLDCPAEEMRQPQREERKTKAKPFNISKWEVWIAYKRVKANRGAAGVDRQSLEEFEQDLHNNLYKIWNRMSSGSYFPPPVRVVEIPKASGGKRPLGIPTVADRIAQTVAKTRLEELVEPIFHDDSYGYRPGKSALEAVGTARQRCWRRDWVIDLDIKGFFDNLDWELILRAVRHHTECPWILLYVERWLKAPAESADGTRAERMKGTPQGGVISPLLANLFMHYAFDYWLARHYPHIQFERYADDAIVHCVSKVEAEATLELIRQRLADCGLELHPMKTRIVYCKDDDRRGDHEHTKFDFLGYTFQPRCARNWKGKFFVSFLPAVSDKAAKRIRATIHSWQLPRLRSNQSLEEIARLVNPYVRGWINYYGRYYRSCIVYVLRHLNRVLGRWARRKWKRLRRHQRQAEHWLGRIARRDPAVFVHWQQGITPSVAGR